MAAWVDMDYAPGVDLMHVVVWPTILCVERTATIPVRRTFQQDHHAFDRWMAALVNGMMTSYHWPHYEEEGT